MGPRVMKKHGIKTRIHQRTKSVELDLSHIRDSWSQNAKVKRVKRQAVDWDG